MLEQLGLAGSIDAIVKQANDTGTPLQKFIGSIEGQTLALALSGAQATTYSEKLSEMITAAGATDKAFLAQTQGINQVGFAWRQTTIRAQVLAEQMGDTLIPMISSLFAAVEPTIRQFTQWIQNNQQLAGTIAVVAVVLGPLLIVVGQLTTSLAAIIPIITTVGGAILGLLNPVVLAIGAVVGLVAVSKWLLGSWEQVAKTFAAVGELIIDSVIVLVRTQMKMWTVFFGWLISKLDDVFTREFVQAVFNGLKEAAKLLIKFQQFAVDKLRSVLTGSETGTFADFIGGVTGDLQRGANTDNILKELGKVAMEGGQQIADMARQRQLLSPEATAHAGRKLEPIQAKIVAAKDEGSKSMANMESGVMELVALTREQLEKEGITLAPLALGSN